MMFSFCDDRREGRREMRRQAILAAAYELFLEKGYEATTLSDVVRRSGGSFATLYELFENKPGLLRAMVRERCGTISAAMDQAICSEQPVEQALRQLAEQLFEDVLDPRTLALFRVVVAQTTAQPELGPLFYEAGPAAGQTKLARFLERQVAAGRLQVDDPLAASQLLFHMLIGRFQQRAVMMAERPSDEAKAAHIDFVLATFLRAFAVRSG